MRGYISRLTAAVLIVGMILSLTGCDYIKKVAANTRKSKDTVQKDISDEELAELMKNFGNIKEDENAGIPDEGYETEPEIGIFVNLEGYDVKGDKKFIVSDNSLDNDYEFAIIRADDESIEYSGITDGCKGDFTQFDAPGKYYIQIDDLGISEQFIIEENHYFNMVNGIMKNHSDIQAKSEENTSDTEVILMRVADLIMSYGFFEENTLEEAYDEFNKIFIHSDENGIFDSKNVSEMYMYSAVAAMLANAYKETDVELASVISKSAANTYDYINEKSGKASSDVKFFAAAELYSLTADRKYKDAAESILSGNEEVPSGFGKNSCGYYGALAYLMTTNKVDTALSGKVMKSLIDDAIETSESEITGSIDDILSDTRLLIVANSISKSVVYVRAAEERFDYLYGVNPQGINYMSEDSKYSNESVIFILYGFDNSYIGRN